MTPQERLFQATQQLAVAQSKVDSAKKADDVASDTLYAATSAAAVAAAKLAFDTTAQAAAIAAEPIILTFFQSWKSWIIFLNSSSE